MGALYYAYMLNTRLFSIKCLTKGLLISSNLAKKDFASGA